MYVSICFGISMNLFYFFSLTSRERRKGRIGEPNDIFSVSFCFYKEYTSSYIQICFIFGFLRFSVVTTIQLYVEIVLIYLSSIIAKLTEQIKRVRRRQSLLGWHFGKDDILNKNKLNKTFEDVANSKGTQGLAENGK